MSATICPTIIAEELNGYRVQMKRVLPFAGRVHIDLMDGQFASPRSVGMDQLYWPANVAVDLHVMYKNPTAHTNVLITLAPRLVIIHAEADGQFAPFAEQLHRRGIEVGIALLPQTPVAAIAPAIDLVDHVVIFSGHLGHYGGTADLRLLTKAQQLRALKPSLEIGWDGGINDANVRQLVAGGIDVLNAGGFIQHAINPAKAYATLESLA